MKRHVIILSMFLLLLVGCRGVEQPFSLEGYDQHITFVDKIDHPDNNLFTTVYGVCYVNDHWNDYPIEIRRQTILDRFMVVPSVQKVINHEKAHRFEAVTKANMDGRWEEFEQSWEAVTGDVYDTEDFAAAYASLCMLGVKTLKQKLVYDFMSEL